MIVERIIRKIINTIKSSKYKFLNPFYYRLFQIKIGMNVEINSNTVITPGFRKTNGIIEINDNCQVLNGVVLEGWGGSIKLEQNVFLGPYVVIYGHGGVSVGANTMISAHTCIFSSNHTVPDKDKLIRDHSDILEETTIGSDVWIGAASVILAGVKIGNGSVIGAGSVVTKDIPEYSIAVGNPSRVIGKRE